MRRGFTLVELLIVIAIIGIMAAGIASIINPVAQFQKANDSRRKSDLAQIQRAFEAYYQDNGRYPPVDTSTSNYRIVGTKIDGSIGALDWGYTGWQYMPVLPKDPSSPSKNYVYNTPTDRQSYYLYASLDRGTSDPQICQNLNTNGECRSLPSGASCGTGAKCNYGVSSPNVSP